MICQRCGENKAVIALQQLNELGKVESLYLCENCATDEALSSEKDLVKAMDTFSEVALDFLTLLQAEGVQNEISRLQEKLAKLVKNEEFEEAAVVRDEIKALKAGGEDK
ncbi:hypothetical protein APD66_07425 [Listeria monocytogenes]|nr:hypothetical protein [Listeria monocytogenes]